MLTIESLKREVKGGLLILDGINLHLKKGESLILKGISGSGKSTLLSIIAGLDRPSSGAVVVDGLDIAKIPQKHLNLYRQNMVGVVFQHFNLIEHLSLFENVLAPLIPQKIDRDTKLKRVEEVMRLAQISHKATTPASLLSGGEKQRCAIARALVNDPSLILFDEPTANLDSKNSQKLIDTLKELHSRGKTLIIATHDPIFDDLPFNSNRVILRDGKIVDE
jgi:putative ABC transport system ATP-binding protein